MSKIDIINSENDIETTAELIQKIINEQRAVRRKDLILETKNRLDIGIATINRHIGILLKQNTIVQIRYPDYKKYGISKEDKKAVYLVLASDTEQTKHYDTIITALNNEDPKIMKNSMIEIDSFEDVKLLPEQLRSISDALKTADLPTCYQIVSVIWGHFEKLIFPSNLKQFEENLITCFERHRKSGISSENYNLRGHILNMLGELDNPIVIKFLKLDIEEFNTALGNLQTWYSSFHLGPIIQKYRTELFNFAHGLPDDKKTALFNIRLTSKNYAKIYDKNIIRFKEKLKEVKNTEIENSI